MLAMPPASCFVCAERSLGGGTTKISTLRSSGTLLVPLPMRYPTCAAGRAAPSSNTNSKWPCSRLAAASRPSTLAGSSESDDEAAAGVRPSRSPTSGAPATASLMNNESVCRAPSFPVRQACATSWKATRAASLLGTRRAKTCARRSASMAASSGASSPSALSVSVGVNGARGWSGGSGDGSRFRPSRRAMSSRSWVVKTSVASWADMVGAMRAGALRMERLRRSEWRGLPAAKGAGPRYIEGARAQTLRAMMTCDE